VQLVDAWRRPFRYALDPVVDGDPKRPAPITGWNPKNAEPFPYLWSLGRPQAGDDDALQANHPRWVLGTGMRP
jgi:hypothetical protein